MLVVTDSASDLPIEEARAQGVIMAPLHIGFADRQVTSSEIEVEEFYRLLESMFPTIPTTSQPSVGEFAELYRTLAQRDKDILSVHISSGLSGTMASASAAAEQVVGQANVQVVDTMTLSGGERFQVLAAAGAARAGWATQAVLERLEAIRAHTEVIFTLETLDYLARGGRIGRVSALLGSLLKLKPVIRVDHTDGKYSTVGKTRTIPQALEAIARHLVGIYGSQRLWVSLIHGRFPDAANALGATLKERLDVGRFDTLRVSPVLGVHTGPGVVGAAVVPLELLEDLIP